MKSADFEEMGATLYLEDGTKFAGHLFGFSRRFFARSCTLDMEQKIKNFSVRGELVFQTGMVGYVVRFFYNLLVWNGNSELLGVLDRPELCQTATCFDVPFNWKLWRSRRGCGRFIFFTSAGF